MTNPEQSPDLDAILREHGGLEGLARELGQFGNASPHMTDQQFNYLILHLRVLIVTTAITAGLLAYLVL